jgi:hypothetical protein
MQRSRNRKRMHNTGEFVDESDLRAVIAKALAVTPVDERSLRLGVWTYVGAKRYTSASPGRVIVELTELVEQAEIVPITMRQAVMRDVILWCVEGYFGHLGGDVIPRNISAFSDLPALAATP